MSKIKIRHQKEEAIEQQLLLDINDIPNDVIDLEGMEKFLQEDANLFLLNNLMMCVQFFENYERDIKLLRENWFKEFLLESYHKKCFFADSLFRLSGVNVKFSPRHGPNKNSKTSLHPLRTYVSSDNVEAAFDPSTLRQNKSNVLPQYRFTVKTNEKTEKSGCIFLVEIETPGGPKGSLGNADSKETTQRDSMSINFEEKTGRRLTKTEMLIGLHNKNLKLRVYDKRCSVVYSAVADGTIPANEFYKFEEIESRLKPKTIHEFRMNSEPTKAHEIPQSCYQYEEVKNTVNYRRAALNSCFRTQRVLNSAAYKGHFCDLLIEKLANPLKLDPRAVIEGSVHQEFIIVNQDGVENRITPVIPIRDWINFVALKRFRDAERTEGLTWPSSYMQRIMNVLPCNAVPDCYASAKEYLDYEKKWKLVFPKTEEFLLLHMMHAHVRCYFFVLLVYKSFIEPEINGASFGPKHLLHLLFWKVHKNFLAWPEDRPAETFLSYLKTLYKKLQNKHLSDFFIISRNLFADSHPKDLHKAQTLIKVIMENPVPYIIRAVSNINLKENFYPTFDYEKLYGILKEPNALEKLRIKRGRKKQQKTVRFQDEEQRWKKKVIKQIELERKAEEQEEMSRLSVDSININEILNFDSDDYGRCHEILQTFTAHFLQMGIKCMDHDCLPQCLMYVFQIQKMLRIMSARNMGQDNIKETREKIKTLQHFCYGKIKYEMRKSPSKTKEFILPSEKTEKNVNSETETKEADTKQEEEEEEPIPENSLQEKDVIIVKL